MALSSIRSARWRSLLTMLGVIIGVLSVVTTVSLAEGAKRQVAGQINRIGNDVISVRSGRAVTRNAHGQVTGFNFLSSFGTSTLSEADIAVIKKSSYVKTAVPLSLITGVVEAEGRRLDNGLIIASTDQAAAVLNQPIAEGSFFGPNDNLKHLAVIGADLARALFNEPAPIGRSLQVRGHTFVVSGVFEAIDRNPVNLGADFNDSVFIPFSTGKTITNNQAQIYQILVKVTDASLVDLTAEEIKVALTINHSGQEDFTVLKPADSQALAGSILNSLSNLIGGIAAISLLVGGIGIMNVMLAAISERTREIGIRKAVGATNRQILSQFLTEAVILSLWGGLIGIGFAGVANVLFRIFTDLKPVLTLQISLLAAGVSVGVGVIFGIFPAVRAARKDPIEALRYE